MMTPLMFTPAAWVCAAPQQGVDRNALKPNAWQKALIEAIQKDGFTIVSSRRERSIWFSIRLELRKNGQPEGSPITVILDPGMKDNSSGEVPPSVQTLAVVDLSKKTHDEARAIAEVLGKNYPDVSIRVGKYPNGSPNLNVRRSDEDRQVHDAARIVRQLNTLLQIIKEASDGNLKAVPEPTDPVGKTLKESGLIFTDIKGFYRLRYDFTDTRRSQTVHIRQVVWDYNSLKVQEAFSVFYESKTAPSAELLHKIFQKSFSIGGLVLEEPSKGQEFWRIRFRIDIPVNCTPDRLKQYMSLLANTSDFLEKDIASEDKL